MNTEIKAAFTRIKPICNGVMVCPCQETLADYTTKVSEIKKEILQELQQYMLYPLITHLKSEEIEKKFELQSKIIDAIRVLLDKVVVNNFQMFLNIETGLMQVVFDKAKPGMLAEVPEELKLSVMRCLSVLLLNVDRSVRQRFLKSQVPLIAQAVFVSVHIAKLDRLRTLRLAAIECLTALTVTHERFLNDKYHLKDASIELTVVDMLASILPGLLSALQDVAMCKENPGHRVVVASVSAIHRILCLPMNDKYLTVKQEIKVEDFTKMIMEKATLRENEVSNKDNDQSPKELPKRTPEWFEMAGDKLTIITKSIVPLRTHENHKVRKELAVYCARLLFECNRSMQPSLSIALDVLISLAKDDHPKVAEYCSDVVNKYFESSSDDEKNRTIDGLCENFFATLDSLPRILNNIDSSRKLSALNLVHGYIQVLCSGGRPPRLTTALSSLDNTRSLCEALCDAASIQTDFTMLTQLATRDVSSPPPTNSPWCKLRHLDTECERRLQDICRLLGDAECSELILDTLLDNFLQQRQCEVAYIMNYIGTAPNSTPSLAKRILETYIEESVWYVPLEVSGGEASHSQDGTQDVSVYNPRAWSKDSVPDLYEGTTETRLTDISYQTPRTNMAKDPRFCSTILQAQRNMGLSCLMTQGVGMMARRLMLDYQPYLLKTLCLLLERVGSKYELLHMAGLRAVNDVAHACGHATVAELINCNADYFTHQVTVRLKKEWNSQSALEILSVVMEYSDSSIMDCLCGIVENVLIQSCDKYHERDLSAYLQVFLTFVNCIHKWYPVKKIDTENGSSTIDDIDNSFNKEINVLEDLMQYVSNKKESERLLSTDEFENESGKSVEEMYKDDLKEKEDNLLEYDDKVTEEKQPLPKHIIVAVTILKRCLHFVAARQRDETILALQVLNLGLPILQQYEDELLPLVHLTWAPLVARFESREPVVLRRAFDLLVTMAALSKDFIRSRAVKEVLPYIYSYLHTSASDSYLKDVGSAYRNSHAYKLQVAALTALPNLAVNLGLDSEKLEKCMDCVNSYLSKKQPKQLQALAVTFFKTVLNYDYGAAWYHLRTLCNNEQAMEPPTTDIKLQKIVGTPYLPEKIDYESNIKLIFSNK